MSQSAPMIVFDLDGTLVDSAPDLIDSLNVILAGEGLPPVSLENGRKYVGKGARIMIRRGLEASGRTVSEARLDEMFAAFLAHYDQHLTDKTRFYPGVEAALDRLVEAGHRLAVLTNKFEHPSKKILRQLGAVERFGAIVGQDTFPVSKPEASSLRLTVEKAGGDPSRAIMVGDTETDVATGRNAGLPVVAVAFGYAPVPVAEYGPDKVIQRFDELPEVVAELARRFTEPAG